MTLILLIGFLLAFGEGFDFEEEIPLSDENIELAESSRSNRPVVINPVLSLEGNRISYEIDRRSRFNRTLFLQAIQHFRGRTCINFTKSLNQPIVPNVARPSCYNKIWKTKGLHSRSSYIICPTIGVHLHEIMHALGFIHEQQRPDRDEYVIVNDDIILPKYEKGFKELEESVTSQYDFPYDYHSVLHSSRTAGSWQGWDTNIPLDPSVTIPDSGESLSRYDIMKINQKYCPGTIGFRIVNDANDECLTDGYKQEGLLMSVSLLKTTKCNGGEGSEKQKWTTDWYALQDPSKGAHLVPWNQDDEDFETLSGPNINGPVVVMTAVWSINQLWWVDRVKNSSDSRWQIKNKNAGYCLWKGTTYIDMKKCDASDRAQLWKMFKV